MSRPGPGAVPAVRILMPRLRGTATGESAPPARDSPRTTSSFSCFAIPLFFCIRPAGRACCPQLRWTIADTKCNRSDLEKLHSNRCLASPQCTRATNPCRQQSELSEWRQGAYNLIHKCYLRCGTARHRMSRSHCVMYCSVGLTFESNNIYSTSSFGESLTLAAWIGQFKA